jgi:hypothetical protein
MLRRRMLIVDDDPDLRGILQECPRIAGRGWRLRKLGMMSSSDDVCETSSQVTAQLCAGGARACLFKPFDQGELTSGAG